MSDLHAADRIKAEAMSIFADPPQETSQDVRDAIEWYHAQLRIELARAALSAPAVPPTYTDWQQRRGRDADIVDEAIASYNAWLLEDDYNAKDAIRKIMGRMVERRNSAPSAKEPT